MPPSPVNNIIQALPLSQVNHCLLEGKSQSNMPKVMLSTYGNVSGTVGGVWISYSDKCECLVASLFEKEMVFIGGQKFYPLNLLDLDQFNYVELCSVV